MNCSNEFCPQALETIEDFYVEHNMVDINGDLKRWGKSEVMLSQAKQQSKQQTNTKVW